MGKIKKVLIKFKNWVTNKLNPNKGDKVVKSLKALSALSLTKNGSDVGFLMQSTKSKKTFSVDSKTKSGSQFVITLVKDNKGNKVADGEEFIVSGDEARYVLVGGSSDRIAVLEAQILKLEEQRDNLETEISDLSDELGELEEEVG